MDIVTHTLSGVAAGTVVSAFVDRGLFKRFGIIGLGGFGGALPDLDAISLWSKFDTTIGAFLGLTHSGKEIYFSKFWYSHHGFLHSLFAGLLLAVLVGFFFFILKKKRRNRRRSILLAIVFFCGFLMHLMEDMPTPAAVWGGVNFFWPSQAYLGGIGDIWWWNNYDIFLIVVSVIIINVSLIIAHHFSPFRLKMLTILVFVCGFAFSLFQMKTRPVDFAYTGHTAEYHNFDMKSKEIQKDILGETLYDWMAAFDNNLPVHF